MVKSLNVLLVQILQQLKRQFKIDTHLQVIFGRQKWRLFLSLKPTTITDTHFETNNYTH